METVLIRLANDKLHKNPYLDTSKIYLVIHEGKAFLYGEVDSFFKKQMAQESLRQVEGICEIVNELKVVNELKGKVANELKGMRRPYQLNGRNTVEPATPHLATVTT